MVDKKATNSIQNLASNTLIEELDVIWDKFLDLAFEAWDEKANFTRIRREMMSLTDQTVSILSKRSNKKLIDWDFYRTEWLGTFYLRLARCNEKCHSYVTAEKYFRKSMRLNPNDVHVYEDYSRFLISRGKINAAAAIMRQTPISIMRSNAESTFRIYLEMTMVHEGLLKYIPAPTLKQWVKLFHIGVNWRSKHTKKTVVRLTVEPYVLDKKA